MSNFNDRSAFGPHSHRKVLVAAGKHGREYLVVVAVGAIERVCLAIHALESDQTAGFARGDGPEQELIHEAEDRNVDPDAEREGYDRHRGEPGIPLELAQPVANVLPERFHYRFPADTSNLFFHRVHAAHFDPRGAQSLLLAHPRAHLLLHGGVQVAAQLFVHFLFHLFLTE